MSSASPKLVAVVGATGLQGGSVIKALLHESEFKLRGLTRDPSKPSAQALAAQGVEVVRADVASEDDLRAAFEGAHAVYAVTQYTEHNDPAREQADGERMARAAAAARVERFLWFSMPGVRELSGGRVDSPFWDSKAAVERALPAILGDRWTALVGGAYWENFLGPLFRPRKGDDGVYTLALPASPQTVYSGFSAAHDTGKFVRAVLKAGDSRLRGERVLLCSEELTFADALAAWGKHNGVPTRYDVLPEDTFKSRLPPMLAHRFTTMLKWMQEYGHFNREDVGPSQRLVADDKLTDWEAFLKETKWDL